MVELATWHVCKSLSRIQSESSFQNRCVKCYVYTPPVFVAQMSAAVPLSIVPVHSLLLPLQPQAVPSSVDVPSSEQRTYFFSLRASLLVFSHLRVVSTVVPLPEAWQERWQ